MSAQPVSLARGVDVFPIVLGTMSFGTRVDEDTCFELLDRFFELGGRVIDTARVYADWLPGGSGASERVIGRWLARSKWAADAVVATKGGHPPLHAPAQARLTRRELERDLDASLELLGTDRVDVYWLHRDDPAVPVADILEGAAPLLDSGRAGMLGVSNWAPERIADALSASAAARVPLVLAHQVEWNLALGHDSPRPADGREVLTASADAWHTAQALPVFAYSAQARGYFALTDAQTAEHPAARYDSPTARARRARVREFARERGHSASAVALAYLLRARPPGQTAVVIGCRTRAQLDDAMSAASIALTPADCESLRSGQ